MFIILYLGSLVCCAYHLFIACTLKSSREIARLWSRYNLPMMFFGGLTIPRAVLMQYSPVMGNLSLANPLMHITEGLRQTIIGGPQFLSFGTCVITLLGFAALFTIGAWYFFKKKVDHI